MNELDALMFPDSNQVEILDTFDYGSITPEIRDEIKQKRDEIKQMIINLGLNRLGSENTRWLGKKLIEIRNLLTKDGLWHSWMKNSGLLPIQSAYAIISTAEAEIWDELSSEEISRITKTALCDLSAKSVSDNDRRQIIELIRAGKKITGIQAKEIRRKSRISQIQSSEILEFSLEEIFDSIVNTSGLKISYRNLRRYHLGLKVKRFVILSGISGTGKTRLAIAYAEAINAEFCLVPVAPHWTTNEDLLGYFNPMHEQYHDTVFSYFLRQAAAEYQQAQHENRNPTPYHLVLDEMNLARVEYYFAKFLSAMEVRMREGIAEIELSPTETVLLPPNLYFIGTINVDETTHGFADKIYDRAQLIELEVDREQLVELLGEVPYKDILMTIWDDIHEVAPFAFRVLDEIKEYIKQAETLEVSWQEALDEQLVQKILPKFKGTDQRIQEALEKLRQIAEQHGFSLSRAKAERMLKTYEQYGFTSYF